MAIGEKLTRIHFNNTITGYANQLHTLNQKISSMVKMVSGISDEELTTMGYTAEDIINIRTYFSALTNMLLNVQGLGVIADGVTTPIIVAENVKYIRLGV